ncbi:GlcNAc-PI de-N-acetylase [Ralstonia sp. 25mfcol4.1]|uniref:PIG-L deacetylase family protein n=1 Tax=Ralstonia sp. 25mfcol4.1 TaxID=1761899 RepID=UPI000491DEDE|nr:PIG-L family deacetylase [Ralstonia sp. 25mfcol4.1]SDP57097.1 GlcNAc-PI de-N-acetylase [Ralstonia sp. 25mfcol4.1]
MPTEASGARPVSAFLFAHQDDEFGAYELILAAVRRGHHVVCAYFTTGVSQGGDSSQRDKESLGVLKQLGVLPADVRFPGTELNISDGQLLSSLGPAGTWTRRWLDALANVQCVYLPAWEGGHPDHDSLHASALMACADAALLDVVRQFPLYNAYRCPAPFFKVLSPLRENGPADAQRIPWGHRIRFLRYALSYPSQRKSWIGLFPFMLLHLVFKGTQAVQRASLTRIAERPHAGPLYYESRRFATWPEVTSHIQAWLARRASAINAPKPPNPAL